MEAGPSLNTNYIFMKAAALNVEAKQSKIPRQDNGLKRLQPDAERIAGIAGKVLGSGSISEFITHTMSDNKSRKWNSSYCGSSVRCVLSNAISSTVLFCLTRSRLTGCRRNGFIKIKHYGVQNQHQNVITGQWSTVRMMVNWLSPGYNVPSSSSSPVLSR